MAHEQVRRLPIVVRENELVGMLSQADVARVGKEKVTGGVVEPGPKQRTRSRALRYLADRVASEPGVERLAVLHGAAPDLDALLDLLAPHFDRDQIVIGDIGPVIGSHSGPRAIGVAYLVAATD